MGTRSLGRKATVFMEKVQVLKAENMYRPVFVGNRKSLIINATTRASYWQDRSERLRSDIRQDAFVGLAPKKYIGGS